MSSNKTAKADSKGAAESTAPSDKKPGNSGPGTDTPAPPEASARPPATVVDPAASPLDPPADAKRQTEPKGGHQSSSTDPVYAEAGGRTIAGEEFDRFVDADGKRLSESALFDDSDAAKTFVTAKTRIYEQFYYPGTTEPGRRLMFAQGRRVPRAQAERIKAAAKDAPEPTRAGD